MKSISLSLLHQIRSLAPLGSQTSDLATNMFSPFKAFGIGSLLLVVILISIASNASAYVNEGMFTPAEPSLNTQSVRAQSSFRTRTVNVDLTKMLPAGDKRELSAGEIADFIPLNLFDDVVFRASRTKTARNRSGSFTWQGTINGKPNSLAIFVVNNDKLYGIVQDPDVGNYSISPDQYGSHIIQEIHPNAVLSGENDYVIPEEDTNTIKRQSVAISNDDGSIIDVYVAYDQDESGGSVASLDAQTYAELFTAYTNQAYENSNINQRIWLVGTVEGYNHTSSSLSTSLTSARDGTIAGLHDKRNEYHADLVLFFTPHSGNLCAGLGYVQDTNSVAAFEDDAFSAMQACPIGSDVFAHELGHNMGSRHDWYMDSGTTPASIAHGYVDVINNYRTIMAYAHRCTALGVSCPNIAHFSNPSIDYNGAATGVPSGTSAACSEGDASPTAECDADNSTNFNDKALITSQFRDSRVTWTGSVNNDWHTAENWDFNSGVPGSTTVVNRVPRSYDNVFIPSGLVNYPSLNSDATARELVILSGATLSMTAGTLTVGWSWEDEGGFSASGGEVIFAGPIGVTIESSSAFNDVQIGTGSDSSEVSLSGDLDINGDFHMRAGARFDAGAHTLNLAGNWTEDDATGFNSSGASSVILDGSNQSLSKVVNVTLLNEDFSDFDLFCCSSTLPNGWATSSGTVFTGPLIEVNDGAANRWRNQTDGYLFTPTLSLQAGVVYQVQYNIVTRRNFTDGDEVHSPQTISVHLGSAQSPGSMTTELSPETAESIDSYETRVISNITVASSGTYYIGFRAQQSGDDYASFDDISVTGVGSLSFHDLTVKSGTASFNEDVSIGNNLLVNTEATFNMTNRTVTVEGTVTNNGAIKQTKNADDCTTTRFGQIQSSVGVTAYSGVEITSAGGSMGPTEVTIFGNQTCSGEGIPTNGVQRCFTITPFINQTADVRFYFPISESNNSTSPAVFRKNSTEWEEQTTFNGGSGDALWASSNGLTSFGTFALGGQSNNGDGGGSNNGDCDGSNGGGDDGNNNGGDDGNNSGGDDGNNNDGDDGNNNGDGGGNNSGGDDGNNNGGDDGNNSGGDDGDNSDGDDDNNNGGDDDNNNDDGGGNNSGGDDDNNSDGDDGNDSSSGGGGGGSAGIWLLLTSAVIFALRRRQFRLP